jgi:uncharacterized protein
METSNWTSSESPFHAGELAIQTRLGLQERIDRQGRRVIREFMPEQHRQFFAQLPYVIVGSVDTIGCPWASILVGHPGFLSSPNEQMLQVKAPILPGDPLAHNLTSGIDIGLLGIELPTRRRNRLNGVVSATTSDSFTIQVKQSFGNCPQYIQTRTSQFIAVDPTLPKPIHHMERFGDVERSLIATADTFFIATAYQSPTAGLASGIDVSHRGGKPGFVRLDDDRTLTIPDFSGNLHFNTFGNLELNPCAGLLFIDFNAGNLLYLTGTAQVIWDSPDIALYAGAERLLQFQLDRGYYVEGSLPLRWSPPEFSPLLDRMGDWGI